MKVLEIVLPVLVMILLGMACRKWKLLNQNGIDNMKVLVTQIMLPVAIFHALATSDYNKETGILVGIMFVMLVISFSLGFAMRPLMPEQRYRKYLPFMVSVYEGGSMAYPLYTSLCGAENLSQIAVLDIAGLLFGFSVYMGMLGQVENGDKIDVKKLFASAIRTPAFIASVLGILAGLSGVVLKILEGPFAGTYTSVENILYQSYCVAQSPNSKSFPLMRLLGLEQKAAAGTITTAEQQELAAGADRLATARATDTDWIGEMTQTGLTMDHSLTLSGGTEKTKFFYFLLLADDLSGKFPA